jgi:hypothetical protein
MALRAWLLQASTRNSQMSGAGLKPEVAALRRDVGFAPGERTLSGCLGVSEKCRHLRLIPPLRPLHVPGAAGAP